MIAFFLISLLIFSIQQIGFGKDLSLDKYQPVEEEKAVDYLSQFGYVSPGQLNAANNGPGPGMAGDMANVFEQAVKKFQEFAFLPVTGILDVKTRKKMAEPRCGLSDGVEMLSSGKGPAFKWRKTALTYAIHNYSPDLAPNQINDAIRMAFNQWAEVTPLTFRQVSPQEQADINIKFAHLYHDDPWPFDQKGGVLAHATMPQDGKLHFDEAEDWVYMDAPKIASLRYTDLLPVAIHEGGHALGLSHSKSEDAIMAPFYQETVDIQGRYKFPALKPDDIRAIQEIYGPRGGGGNIPRKHSHAEGNAPRKEEGGGRTGGQQQGNGGDDLIGTVWKQGKNVLKNMFIEWLRKQDRRK